MVEPCFDILRLSNNATNKFSGNEHSGSGVGVMLNSGRSLVVHLLRKSSFE